MKLDQKRKDMVRELSELSADDLKARTKELKEQVFWLNFKNRSGQAIKISELQKSKKMIARLMTLSSAKQAASKAKEK